MDIKRALVLDCVEPVSKAENYLMDNPAVIITKEGKDYGMVDHRCIKSMNEHQNVKCETVMIRSPVLKEDSELGDRVEAFLVGHFKALPVLDGKNRPLGVVTRTELLGDLKKSHALPEGVVDEIMHSPVYTIDYAKNLGDAKKQLKEKGVHRLVVTKSGNSLGVVSAFDIAMWESRGKTSKGRKDTGIDQINNIERMRVEEFVRGDVISVEAGTKTGQLVDEMIKKKVSHAIVTSNKKPVGVVSVLDVLKQVNQKQSEVQIAISGLGGDTLVEYSDIEQKLLHVIEKFGKTFSFRNVSLHVKEKKSAFVLNLYAEADDGHISIKEERSSIKEGIDRICHELSELLRKKKEIREARKW